jgi:hypothetical protein
MRSLLVAAAVFLVVVGCQKSDLDKKIVGVWENAGTPSSMALPESVRLSASWSATIEFKPDGTFDWQVDNGAGGSDRWTGNYEVVGYSVSIELAGVDGRSLTPADKLKYTVRQQDTGSIRLPLPQDWTGPSVDYFPRN